MDSNNINDLSVEDKIIFFYYFTDLLFNCENIKDFLHDELLELDDKVNKKIRTINTVYKNNLGY